MAKQKQQNDHENQLKAQVIEAVNFIHNNNLYMFGKKKDMVSASLTHYVNDLNRNMRVELFAQELKKSEGLPIDAARARAEKEFLTNDDIWKQDRDIWMKSQKQVEELQAEIEVCKEQNDYQTQLLRINMIDYEYQLAMMKRPLQIKVG